MKAISKDGALGMGALAGVSCDGPTCDSLLVPIYRIIEKNVSFIDLEHIDRHHKRANKTALDYYCNEVIKNKRNKLLANEIIDYYSITLLDRSADELLNQLTSFESLQLPLQVINSFNKKKIEIYNNALISYSNKMFNKYLDQFKKNYRCVLITKFNNEGKKDNFLFKLDNRYCNSYRKKVKKRMSWLTWKYGNSKAVLLTLTLDPKLYNNDKLRMWNDIKPQYHRFITALKYHFKNQNRIFPKYICSIEAQRNGNPHLHIVFLEATRLIDWREIEKLWHQGFIYINRTHDKKKIRYPINYITKYITKTFCDTKEKNLLTQSLSWLFNIRSFSCSRRLIIPLKPKSSGVWTAECLLIVENEVEISFLLEHIDLIVRVMEPLNQALKNI